MDFEHYAVTKVSPDRCEGKSGRHDGALTLAAGPETTVEIMLSDGNPNLLDSKPLEAKETIKGTPAVLSPDGTLILDVQGHLVIVLAREGAPGQVDRTTWKEGQRDLLIQTAEDLTVAPDRNDRSTWFDANSTLTQ